MASGTSAGSRQRTTSRRPTTARRSSALPASSPQRADAPRPHPPRLTGAEANRCHPDKAASRSESAGAVSRADEHYKLVNKAYATLRHGLAPRAARAARGAAEGAGAGLAATA